jgi:hypothetical protein
MLERVRFGHAVAGGERRLDGGLVPAMIPYLEMIASEGDKP